jgi:hypothetical protein
VADTATVAETAFVGPEALVFGSAWVYGEALVYGSAQVYGEAWVSGSAQVSGSAKVFDAAWVSGAARVYDAARVFGEARVSGSAQVFGSAMLDSPSSFIHGCARGRSGIYPYTLTKQNFVWGCREGASLEAWVKSEADYDPTTTDAALLIRLERVLRNKE